MKRIIILLMMLMPLFAMGQSKLYQQYAKRTDATVTEVKGFKLADTVRVDVVLIVADDDAAWERLQKEFAFDGTKGVTSWLGEQRQPAQRTKWDGRKPVCRVVASHAKRTIGLYNIERESQYDALIDYQLNNIRK